MAPEPPRAFTDSERMYRTSAPAATKKPAKQPTASSSPAKFEKPLETENKQSATAVSDALDEKLVDEASARAPAFITTGQGRCDLAGCSSRARGEHTRRTLVHGSPGA